MKLYLLILTLILFSCTGKQITDPSQIVFPATNVSFTQHVQPFMLYYCSFSGCHSEVSSSTQRVMKDYYSFFDTYNLGLVIPYKPDNSRLIQIIDNFGLHIPMLYLNITDAHKKGMRQWVLEGAKYN